MEFIGAIIHCVVALGLGFLVGYRWTMSTPWHLVAGLVVGEASAIAFFMVANWVGRAWPGMLDARLVGVVFMGLAIVTALLGLFGAWFGYRKSLGRGLF